MYVFITYFVYDIIRGCQCTLIMPQKTRKSAENGMLLPTFIIPCHSHVGAEDTSFKFSCAFIEVGANREATQDDNYVNKKYLTAG
jgi:hypothetical protein